MMLNEATETSGIFKKMSFRLDHLVILFLITTSSARDDRFWIRNLQQQLSKGRSQSIGNAVLAKKFSHLMQVQQIQRKILTGLNITHSPIDPPVATRNEAVAKYRKTTRKSAWMKSDTMQEKEYIPITLAEPLDSHDEGMMKFRISSYVVSHLKQVESAVLALRLKFSKKTRKMLAAKRKKMLKERKHLQQLAAACESVTTSSNFSYSGNNQNNSISSINMSSRNNNSNNSSSCDTSSSYRNSSRSCNSSNGRSSTLEFGGKDCQIMLSGKELKRKFARMRKRLLKPKKVKIVVRLMDLKSNKRKRIYTGDVLVMKSKMVTVTISRDLLMDAVQSSILNSKSSIDQSDGPHSNNTSISVQILCRRCKRKVLLDGVHRRNVKRKRGKLVSNNSHQRLNPNRPYLIIKMKTSNSRRKRSHQTDVNEVERFKSDRKNGRTSFGRTSYHHKNKNSVYKRKNDYNIMTSAYDTYIANTDKNRYCHTQKRWVTFEELGFSNWIMHPKGFPLITCHGSCKKESVYAVHFGQGDNVVAGRYTVNTPDRKCIPLGSKHLELIYFINSTTVVHGQIANFIDSMCGCAWG